MLDINLFREDKGNNPEVIRESQRRRFANVDIVDEIISLDKEWRQRNDQFPFFLLLVFLTFIIVFVYRSYLVVVLGQFELDNLRKEFNQINKRVAKLKIVSVFI